MKVRNIFGLKVKETPNVNGGSIRCTPFECFKEA